MAQLKKWSPVIVAWVDAVTVHDPAHSDDKFPCAQRKSIGFLIRRTKESVTIAMEDDRNADLGDDDCQTVTTIPAGMIRSITVLQPDATIQTRRKRASKTRCQNVTVTETNGSAVCPAPEQRV